MLILCRKCYKLKKLSCVDLCWYPDYIFKKKIENEKVFKNNGKPTISC